MIVYKIGLVCTAMEALHSQSRVPVVVGGGGGCKVIFISNPTTVEVVLS